MSSNPSHPESNQYIQVRDLRRQDEQGEPAVVWDSRSADTPHPPKDLINSPDHHTVIVLKNPDGTIRRQIPIDVSASFHHAMMQRRSRIQRALDFISAKFHR